MLCAFVSSVENTGRLEESQDELTGEFTSSHMFTGHHKPFPSSRGLTEELDEMMGHT